MRRDRSLQFAHPTSQDLHTTEASIPANRAFRCSADHPWHFRCFHLYAANTLTRLATSSPFTVASSTMLSTVPASAPAGASVVVTWDGLARAMPTDWIGLYAEGAIGGAYT